MSALKGLLCCLPCRKGKEKEGKAKARKKQTDVETREPLFRSRSIQGVKSIAERTRELMDQSQRSGQSQKKLEKKDLWKERNSSDTNAEYTRSSESSFTTSTPRYSNYISNYMSHKNQDFSFKKELEFAEFGKFAEAKNLMEVLQSFSEMCDKLGPEAKAPTFNTMFPFLRQELKHRIPNKYDKLLQLLESNCLQGVWKQHHCCWEEGDYPWGRALWSQVGHGDSDAWGRDHTLGGKEGHEQEQCSKNLAFCDGGLEELGSKDAVSKAGAWFN